MIFIILCLSLSLSFAIGTLDLAYGLNKGITPKEGKKEQKELKSNYFTGNLKKRNPAFTVSVESVFPKLKEELRLDIKNSN